MKQLAYSDVPVWLRDSEFYQNLSCDEGPDSHIDLPPECLRETDSVNSLQDLAEVLKVMGFWGVKCIPLSVLEFCYLATDTSWVSVIVEGTGEGSLEHKALTELFVDRPSFTLDAALSTRRPEFVAFWLRHVKPDDYGRSSYYSIAQACRYGKLDLVQTLHERGFEWSSYAYCAVAQYGHLHVLKYLHEKGCPLNSTPQLFAARGGQVECMKYLHTIGCPWSSSVLLEFAVPAHYAVLASRKDPSLPWTDDFSILPPAGGYIDCLRYALENGCPCTNSHAPCNVASKYGLIDCIELLRQYNAPCDCTSAARYGQLEILQFLHKSGCRLEQSAAECAASTGQLACLQYLLENGCYGEQEVYQCAARGGHLECLRFSMEQEQGDNFLFYPCELLYAAASSGSLPCLKYLIEVQKAPILAFGSTMVAAALTHGAFDCVKYLVDLGCSLEDFCAFNDGSSDFGRITPMKDQDLLNCIVYLVEHGWRYDKNLYDYIVLHQEGEMSSFQLPLCLQYVIDNNWKETVMNITKRKIED